MTTIFVDLVNLDGSRPEGRLRFSLEQLRVGDPDVVPSSVEVVILDGKARVENLLPGEMKVLVSTGRWSKEWPVAIPDDGTHDLFDLLGTSAPEFEHALWASLLGRVEALENAPVVDLAPLEDATRNLSGRIEKAEKRIESVNSSLISHQFSLSQRELPKLKNQLAELQAHFAPVELVLNGDIEEALTPIYETGTTIGLVQHAGRVSISFRGFDIPGLLQALGELKTSHFPKAAMFADGEDSNCSVELYQGAKFLTKIEPRKILLHNRSGELTFQMALNEVLAVVQETGATNIYLSTFYYTNDLPPEITE
jgi:hypothetical protein